MSVGWQNSCPALNPTNHKRKYPMKKFAILAALAAATVSANAQVNTDFVVTEIMYTGLFGEFIEVTNLSGSSITDLDKYSYDDSSAVGGTIKFPSVTLLAGQAVIITEVSATIFNQAWYTEPTTDPVITNAPVIIANSDQNLGRADTVNIFYNSGTVGSPSYAIRDSVSYDDQNSNGPRSEDVSAVPYFDWDPTLPNFINGGVADWVLSTNAKVTGDWKAGVGGNGPGGAPIPGPWGSPGVAVFASPR